LVGVALQGDIGEFIEAFDLREGRIEVENEVRQASGGGRHMRKDASAEISVGALRSIISSKSCCGRGRAYLALWLFKKCQPELAKDLNTLAFVMSQV
jgi:hypothetical protein